MSAAENIRSFLLSVPTNIKVVAVSKTKTQDVIREVYDEGHRVFGENKIQELTTKSMELPSDIEWHMVGHLQSNKVKFICPFINLIHSVDSLKLLGVINKEGQKNNRIIDVLLQMYIADEETKFGLDERELYELLASAEFSSFENIRIRGLMGMATYTDIESKIRTEFRNLAKIFNDTKKSFFRNTEFFTELSMGMSNDYKIALEEGATIIRIGSLIFGERNY
jgi:PLP dependent protein